MALDLAQELVQAAVLLGPPAREQGPRALDQEALRLGAPGHVRLGDARLGVLPPQARRLAAQLLEAGLQDAAVRRGRGGLGARVGFRPGPGGLRAPGLLRVVGREDLGVEGTHVGLVAGGAQLELLLLVLVQRTAEGDVAGPLLPRAGTRVIRHGQPPLRRAACARRRAPR